MRKILIAAVAALAAAFAVAVGPSVLTGSSTGSYHSVSGASSNSYHDL